MIRLSVNVNKVATLRNARGGDRPSVRQAAEVAVAAGCHGITVHPRPDERHIRRADVQELASWLPVELNIEGYPGEEWMRLVERIRPAQATLVPDPPEVLTSNSGWKFREVDRLWLVGIVARLRAAGIRVSLFVDPAPREVEGAKSVGADRVELYTEAYARAFATKRRDAVFARYRAAAERATALGLGVNAGHDLDLENLPYLAQNLPGLAEVSIGHALISDALFRGLDSTVKAYLAALRRDG
ncbi:MAG: pyridoxine 5'-phosphate synthase [Thermoanaerobaculia bacterium]|nr:MAG: pyridoxine 5'-phosphate synthase [Thermoanaerobaculia bacterium]